VRRTPVNRAVRLTVSGRTGLANTFGVHADEIGVS
jgi:hypothetical protein